MNYRTAFRSIALALLLCTTSAVLAADPPANDPHARHSMSAGSPRTASSGSDSASMQMHQAMMDGMKEMHSMQPTGDADKDFAKMMEHHHAQAVKMTQAYLKGAKNPKLKAWAQKSLDSQQKELRELRALDVTAGSSRQADTRQ